MRIPTFFFLFSIEVVVINKDVLREEEGKAEVALKSNPGFVVVVDVWG